MDVLHSHLLNRQRPSHPSQALKGLAPHSLATHSLKRRRRRRWKVVGWKGKRRRRSQLSPSPQVEPAGRLTVCVCGQSGSVWTVQWSEARSVLCNCSAAQRERNESNRPTHLLLLFLLLTKVKEGPGEEVEEVEGTHRISISAFLLARHSSLCECAAGRGGAGGGRKVDTFPSLSFLPSCFPSLHFSTLLDSTLVTEQKNRRRQRRLRAAQLHFLLGVALLWLALAFLSSFVRPCA